MASYTPNVPVVNQTLGNSQNIINQNFMAISELVGVNHQNFGLSNQGTHTHADLLAQSANPNPGSGLVSHYSKVVSGATEWFFQRESSGPVIQMSTVSGTPVVSANGQTFLPGGLVMRYGNVSIVLASSSTTITFVNAFTTLYSLQFTVTGAFNPQICNINDGDYSTSGFKVSYSDPYSSAGHVFWTAIGV